MANTKISNLTASASNLAASDLVPVVQTPGVGPVKMTGTQIKTGIIGAGSVSIASGKTFTASNTLTLAGTDSTTMTFPSTSATIARTDAGNTFTGNQVITEAVGGSGLTITGATQTTSQPVLNLTQTWNAGAVTFTGLKFNVTNTASAALSLALDIQKGGTTQAAFGWYAANMVSPGLWLTNATPTTTNYTLLNISNSLYINAVSSSGAIWNNVGDIALTYADQNTFSLRSTMRLGWGSGNPGSTPDLILTRANTATLQLGAADAAAPVAQTLQVQSVVAGTSNTAGTNFTIAGSKGTGTGAGGSIIFQVAPAGSSGTAQNAYSTALTITGSGGVCATSLRSGNTIILYPSDADAIANTNRQVYIAGGGGTYNIGITGFFGIAGSDPAATDTKLFRDTTSTLALRNGTNAQRFNVYNTYTSSTNYETFKIDWITTANTCLIGTEKGSSGTARALALQTDGTTRLTIAASGVITSSQNIIIDQNAPAAIGTPFLRVGGASYAANGFYGIGLGYMGSATKKPPVEIGADETSGSGETYGDFYVATRSVTTDTAPTIRLRITAAGKAEFSDTIKTGTPTGGTAAEWKLGSRVAATTTLDTTQYIELDVGGTLYKLAVVTS